jgi:hypothetical protein
MAARTSIAWMFCLAISGCGGVHSIWLDIPGTDGESAVFFLPEAADPEFFALHRASSEGRVSFSLPSPDESHVVEALVFNQPLPQLGLRAGPIQPLPPGEGERISGWTSSYAAVIRDNRSDGWRPTDEPSEFLKDLRVLGPPRPCPEVRLIANLATDVRSDGRFAVPVSPTSALVLFDNRELLLVRTDGSFDQVQVAGESAPELTSLALDEDGQLWAGSTRLHRAELNGLILELEDVGSSSSSTPLFRLAPGIDEGGLEEIFAMGKEGHFKRFSQGDWQDLHRFPPESGAAFAVSRLGPGEAIASFESGPEAAYFRRGHTALESLGTGNLQAVGHVPGVGVLATATGQVYLRAPDETWRRLEDNPVWLGIRVIHPLARRESFIMGGGNGLIAIWTGGRFCQELCFATASGSSRPCASEQGTLRVREHYVNAIAQLEDGTLLVAGNNGNSQPLADLQLLELVWPDS